MTHLFFHISAPRPLVWHLILWLFGLPLLTIGQQRRSAPAPFVLNGTIAGLPAGTRCPLTYHAGTPQNVVPVGMAVVGTGGRIRLVLNTLPAPGIYWLTLPGCTDRPLPVVIGTAARLTFQTVADRPAEAVHWLDSPENEGFAAYRHDQAALAHPADQQAVRDRFCRAHPDWFVTKWLLAADMPTGPAARAHYFETLDLTDTRLLRTDFFDRRLFQYLQVLTPPVADSVIRAVDKLMAGAAPNPVMAQAVAGKIAVAYERPMLFIGSDKVFVHLVDRYYRSRPDWWSATTRQQLGERADALRPLLVGQTMPDLPVRDPAGITRMLHTVEARYTVLYFYSLDCPHCREHAPKLAAFQGRLRARGVQVVAIAVEPDAGRWRQFIAAYHTESLLNGLNVSTQAGLMKQFGIVEYPMDYILDRQKRILAKRINPALFEALIDYLDAQPGQP